MKSIIGDLWSFRDDYRIVTTNGIIKTNGQLVMGAGVALEAKLRYPALPDILGKYVKSNGNYPFISHKFRIITLPTKHHFRDQSDINLIVNSCKILIKMLNTSKIERIYMPRPGCGNGGLNWDDVEPILNGILDDRFIVVSA